MRRARALAAKLLLAAARRLVGEDERDEEEDDGGLPAGHPVVSMSEVARAMIAEGTVPALRATPPSANPALSGSLRARIDSRRSP